MLRTLSGGWGRVGGAVTEARSSQTRVTHALAPMIEPAPQPRAPQHGRPRVDDHPVLHNRVARYPLHRLPVTVQRKALGPERGPLIDAHVAPDLAGLADHHPGAVVDEKPLADAGPGMDVDPGRAVRVLGYDPRGINGISSRYNSCAMRCCMIVRTPG